MEPHVASREEWLTARLALLEREKALTRASDALARDRQALPWVRIEKDYVFDGPQGAVTLASLFGDRSQLIVNHFMLGPDWEQGCVGCSFGADQVEGALVHLAHRDVAYVAISRAPFARIAAFKERMGWRFDWVSSLGNDFNFDFAVSFPAEDAARGRIFYNYAWRDIPMEEMPGFSVFARNAAGEVFHTYSTYARGTEKIAVAYALLDLLPNGRDEGPGNDMSTWVRHHDRYDTPSQSSCCAGS